MSHLSNNIDDSLRYWLDKPFDPYAILSVSESDVYDATAEQVNAFNALISSIDGTMVTVHKNFEGSLIFSVAGTHPMRSTPGPSWYGSIGGKPSDVTAMLAATPPKAPRVTPEQIDAAILAEQYYVFPGTTLTVCALTLQNGFVVTGESAAASPENFNEVLGRTIARKNAREKIWALEGYVLRNHLTYNAIRRG